MTRDTAVGDPARWQAQYAAAQTTLELQRAINGWISEYPCTLLLGSAGGGRRAVFCDSVACLGDRLQEAIRSGGYWLCLPGSWRADMPLPSYRSGEWPGLLRALSVVESILQHRSWVMMPWGAADDYPIAIVSKAQAHQPKRFGQLLRREDLFARGAVSLMLPSAPVSEIAKWLFQRVGFESGWRIIAATYFLEQWAGEDTGRWYRPSILENGEMDEMFGANVGVMDVDVALAMHVFRESVEIASAECIALSDKRAIDVGMGGSVSSDMMYWEVVRALEARDVISTVGAPSGSFVLRAAALAPLAELEMPAVVAGVY